MGQRMGQCFKRQPKATSTRPRGQDTESRVRLTCDPVQPNIGATPTGMTSKMGSICYTTITDDRLEPLERDYAIAHQAFINTTRQIEAMKHEWADLSASSQELYVAGFDNHYDDLKQKLESELATMQTCHQMLTTARRHQNMLNRSKLQTRGKEMLKQVGVKEAKLTKLVDKVKKDADELHNTNMTLTEQETELADDDRERERENESMVVTEQPASVKRHAFLTFAGGFKAPPASIELAPTPSAVAPAAVTVRRPSSSVVSKPVVAPMSRAPPMQYS